MSDHLFGLLDLGLVVALVFGLALWQLVAVRRSIARDRQDAETKRAPEP